MGHPRRHSNTEEDVGLEGARGEAGGTRRRPSLFGGILVIAIAIGIVVLMVILHLTGTLGPGSH
jgi:hypothetical protein